MRSILFPLGLALAVACGPTPQDYDDADAANQNVQPDALSNPNEFADAAPRQACDKMDILFVIDNSGSMDQEQTNLAANFPQFISVLESFGDLDYRVGLTSTGRDYTYYIDTPIGPLPNSQSGGDNGALLQRCDMTRRWVEKGDPDPAGTFSCAAQLGAGGPNDEMPLAVIHDALTDRLTDGTNNGFIREDALLAIVILTDEDDCSYEQEVTLGFTQSLCDDQMEPVQTYSSFLDTFTGAPGRWAVAVIAGETQCSSEFGGAAEAVRLKQFANLAGQNGVVSSICAADLSQPLADALETFDTACQNIPPIE